MTEALTDKYLDLSAILGVDRSDCFHFLIESILKSVSRRKDKLLSTGGKEVLLKVIAQTISMYAMSVFKTPNKCVKGLLT